MGTLRKRGHARAQFAGAKTYTLDLVTNSTDTMRSIGGAARLQVYRAWVEVLRACGFAFSGALPSRSNAENV